MPRPAIPPNTSVSDSRNDRLRTLVTRIAGGDRAAFRTVYAFLVMRVWCDALRLLPPADARAVTRSTFVEIWHLARHHLDHDECTPRAWVQEIIARYIEDRCRTANGARPLQRAYDHHTHRELISLLGTGEATIRTGSVTFTRVTDLAP
jgi:DNA-directed RNA polymerase specialized sigma24 family protein